MRAFDMVARSVFAEPFQPFRVVLADGRSLPVRDPDMTRISGRTFHLDTAWADDADGYDGQEVRVSYTDVVAVELLTAPASGS